MAKIIGKIGDKMYWVDIFIRIFLNILIPGLTILIVCIFKINVTEMNILPIIGIDIAVILILNLTFWYWWEKFKNLVINIFGGKK